MIWQLFDFHIIVFHFNCFHWWFSLFRMHWQLHALIFIIFIQKNNSRCPYPVRLPDFRCNKVRRCLWNQKVPPEKLVSMMAAKLKACWHFGQRNKFQGSLKLLAAQHKQILGQLSVWICLIDWSDKYLTSTQLFSFQLFPFNLTFSKCAESIKSESSSISSGSFLTKNPSRHSMRQMTTSTKSPATTLAMTIHHSGNGSVRSCLLSGKATVRTDSSSSLIS